MPRISIITVCRNSAATLTDTLNSVSAQSFDDFEHLIMDGASTDGSLELLHGWRNHPLRIHSAPDRGMYDAMNQGIAQARGDIVGFLNADDTYYSNEVLAQIDTAMAVPSIDLCHADLVYVRPGDLTRSVRHWRSRDFHPGLFAHGWCPAHPTFYVRRRLYRDFGGFDERYRYASDVELMMRFLEVCKARSVHVPALWVRMRLGGQSNQSLGNIVRQNREILDALRRHRLPVSSAGFIARKLASRLTQFGRARLAPPAPQ